MSSINKKKTICKYNGNNLPCPHKVCRFVHPNKLPNRKLNTKSSTVNRKVEKTIDTPPVPNFYVFSIPITVLNAIGITHTYYYAIFQTKDFVSYEVCCTETDNDFYDAVYEHSFKSESITIAKMSKEYNFPRSVLRQKLLSGKRNIGNIIKKRYLLSFILPFSDITSYIGKLLFRMYKRTTYKYDP